MHRSQRIQPGRRIVLLLPGLAANGGIQRHNRMLCRELTHYARRSRLRLEVVSLHDPAGWHDADLLARPLTGCAGNKMRFVGHLICALSRPYALCVLGHIDFGGLVRPFQILRPQAPLVAQTYGVEVWRRRSPAQRQALGAARAVWTISNYTAEQLTAVQGVERGRVEVFPIPLDQGFAAGLAAWNVSGAAPRHTHLLTVARLGASEEGKGIDQVIAALPAVRARVPDLTYTIIGEGDDLPRLKALAATHGVLPLVHFAGRVSDADLHAYLHGADLFVMPSRKEGFGIVFVEAMAHGVPVIAGAHAGSPEVVPHGETGLLVRNDDREGLVDAIGRLLADPALRRRMGEAGRRRVATVYAYPQFRARIAQAVDRMLA